VPDALIEIHSPSGLDATDLAKPAFESLQFESEIVLTAHGRSVDGKDVIAVIPLREKVGTCVGILTIGPDEIQAVRNLASTLVSGPEQRKRCS
jgi:phosphocarrier protein HPr